MSSFYFKFTVLLILTLISLLHLSIAQSTSECCSTNLMDATGLVAIETQRPLVTSDQSFPALTVRGCTTDSVGVQIWRRVSDNTFQFRWQTEITPVDVENGLDFITISLGEPLQLTPDDRLGVFTLMSNDRVSIPFKLDPSAAVYHSTQRYSVFDGFDATTQITTDDTPWPRTFNSSVIFCREAGCTDLPAQTNPSIASTISSTTTARNTVSTGPCCPTYPVSCDPTDVTDDLKNQTGRIIELQNTINLITRMINDLFSSRPTGTCPSGFTPGTIGVGKCYMLFRGDPVQMAVAVLRCRDNFQARLVTIESVSEELFLKSMILNNTAGASIENYWMSGMYNKGQKAWFWYDDSTRQSTTQTYRNWQGGTPPVPTSDNDICSTLTVDLGIGNDYWLKQYCTSANFYICEQPKTCL